MLRLNLVYKILAVAVISLLFLFLFSSFVPLNTDEFIYYHALSSHYYPLNMLNTFRDSGTAYDLAPFSNVFLPLRSYAYVGSFPCVLYYPLFRLWPSPYSARFLGLMMLALQAFFIYKLFKADFLISFVFLLSFMPYAFQHVADTGPVSFQITSVFIICYLARAWMLALGKGAAWSLRYPFSIAVILGLGMWTKPVYLAMLPGIFILVLYFVISERRVFTLPRRLKTFITHISISLIALGVPVLLFLNSSNRSGRRCYELIVARFSEAGAFNINILARRVLNLAKYLFNPLLSAHRMLKTSSGATIAGTLLVTVIIALLYFGVRGLRLKRMKYGFPILGAGLFLLTFFLIAAWPRSWAMHHVILSFPFLVLALAYILPQLRKSRLILGLFITFVAINAWLYFGLTGLKYRMHDHPSKQAINELLNKKYADNYVFIVIDWGMYDLKSLYGDKDQCVLYIEPFDTMEEARGVKKILKKTKRKAMFVGRARSVSDLSLIKSAFPGLRRLDVDFDTGDWRIWYQP